MLLRQLNLSWLERLLPESICRRGFDFQHQQHHQQRCEEQRQHLQPEGHAQQLTEPLLPSATAADCPASPAAAPLTTTAASPLGCGSYVPSTAVVEVNAAGMAGSNMTGSDAPGGGSGGQQDIGPPAVEDVWQAAVESLQHNGGDVKVSWQRGCPTGFCMVPACVHLNLLVWRGC